MMRGFLALAAALLWGLPAGALLQGDTPARIKSRSELVVVPVTVKDSHGNLVSDLRRDEFRVFDDGAEQEIVLFSVDPFPLSAVVVLDNNLPVKTADQVQKSLESIAAGFGPNDEVALELFDQFPETVLDFTASNDKFFTQLKRMKLGSSFPGEGSPSMSSVPLINGRPVTGGVQVPDTKSSTVTKNINDAVYAAGQMLKARGRDRRKIIFLISDGSNSRHNQWSYEDSLQSLLKSDVSVYAVGVGSSFLRHESNLLPKYATATGGDFFYASSQHDLERLYSRLTEEARNQYTLAYAPRGAERSRDYHSIEVRVRRPDLDLLARQGYYSPSPR
jgi:VWFA-related protein